MKKGIVYLVGGGPGDPGLFTLKGLDLIKRADVIMYDRLVDKRLLDYAGPGAELIYVGKIVSQHTFSQTRINRVLAQKAARNRIVVRLKGGDPFMFGRGGEEIEYLIKQGIRVEVVPGVSALSAVPIYAGIPITHRDYASTVTVLTGHEQPGKNKSRINWSKIATASDTLIIFMGLGNLGAIIKKLIQHGRSKRTPIALIRRGTTLSQETLTGTLETIVSLAQKSQFKPPVLIVIGEVVKLRNNLRWFDNSSLFGKRILVTRAREQASVLSELLKDCGAEVVEVPCIKIEPLKNYAELDVKIARINSYDWIVFTSVNGVNAFLGRFGELGNKNKRLKKIKIAAIGPQTAEAIRKAGLKVNYVPKRFIAEAVVKGFPEKSLKQKKILLPRAQGAREVIPQVLSRRGAVVDEVTVYRTVAPLNESSQLQQMLKNKEIDLITFCSSSAVNNFMKVLSSSRPQTKKLLAAVTIACIGPITAATVKRAGLSVDIIAREYTIKGLVKSIVGPYGPDYGKGIK